MVNLLSVSEKAITQIKRIIKNAPLGTEGIIVGVDKSGCSGYSYKIEFANQKNTLCIVNHEFTYINDIVVTGIDELNPEKWNHVVLTRFLDTFYLYLNGVLQGTSVVSSVFKISK